MSLTLEIGNTTIGVCGLEQAEERSEGRRVG